MAKHYLELNDRLIAFIEKQPLFFVATAAAEGRVNVSPKGMDTLRVLSPSEILWLNLTGSGNETAAHIIQQNRMTLMFCSFSSDEMKVLRLYGRAEMIQTNDPSWDECSAKFPGYAGQRQIFSLKIDHCLTSCGFGVPEMSFTQERPMLDAWARKKGPSGLRDYHLNRNATSLDGYSTGIQHDV